MRHTEVAVMRCDGDGDADRPCPNRATQITANAIGMLWYMCDEHTDTLRARIAGSIGTDPICYEGASE